MSKPRIVVLSIAGIAIIGLLILPTWRDRASDSPGQDAPGSKASIPGQSPRIDGGVGENPAASTGSEPTPGSIEVPEDPFPPDFALGSYRRRHPDDNRPEGCILKNGQSCQITFTGSYRLFNYETALIGLGAYEDGSTTRVSGGEIRVGRGVNRWYIVYHYGVSARQTVQFKIQLLTLDGTVLYEHPLRVLTLDE